MPERQPMATINRQIHLVSRPEGEATTVPIAPPCMTLFSAKGGV